MYTEHQKKRTEKKEYQSNHQNTIFIYSNPLKHDTWNNSKKTVILEMVVNL